jgi:hypothetical protein
VKRGGPLRRLTPLRTKRLSLTRSVIKATRAKVTPAERHARKAVKARSNGRCELGPDHPATDMHHRRNRSQGGLWTPENLLHICRGHHQHITTHPQAAIEQGWTVPSHRDPADVPCWLAGWGYSFLNPDGSITESEEEESA